MNSPTPKSSLLTPKFYSPAPAGSPDAYVVVEPTVFRWINPPRWAWKLAALNVSLPEGILRRTVGFDGVREIELFVRPGFHFSVSVAPDHPDATPSSCPHDLLCRRRREIAAAWGCSVYRVRQFGDHFFLALLRHDRFGFKRTYFLGVCFWSRLTAAFEKPSPAARAAGNTKEIPS